MLTLITNPHYFLNFFQMLVRIKGSHLRLITDNTSVLFNSIQSKCAACGVFFIFGWLVVTGLLLFLFCHLHAVSLLTTPVSYSSAFLWDKGSILIQVMG